MKGYSTAMNRVVQAGDQEDFATFDYILCMEESNLKDLNRKRKQVKNGKAKIEPHGAIIHESDISGKIPIVSDSSFKTIYSSVHGAVERSWRKCADTASVPWCSQWG